MLLSEIKGNGKRTQVPAEFLKNVKLQAAPNIQPGGCIVETNYGVIDARIAERTSKLWDEISQTLPKVKSKVG